jgi:hypothetical protein
MPTVQTEARRLRDDLVRSVDVLGTPQSGDRLHLGDRLEELHADRGRSQSQQLVELIDEPLPVVAVGYVGVSPLDLE